jgi:hypothetical protein
MNESHPMPDTDNMGREKFWIENDGLALKLFKNECCSGCGCSTTSQEDISLSQE